MSDRPAQAWAEAERQWPGVAEVPEIDVMRSDMRRGFMRGVEWADTNPQPAAALWVDPSDMKMLGEALAVAENRLLSEPQYRSLARHLGGLLRQVNHHRPTGTDGKHGDLHTATCGCDDANPQPHTITRAELEQAWWDTCPDAVDHVLDKFVRRLGIEVEDDDE